MQLPEGTIGFIAGIIDGEGSITIEIQSKCEVRKDNYYSVRLLVINTCKPLVDWLEKTLGGHVSTRKKIEGQKYCYKWNICSYNARDILIMCLPYMIVKKKQAEVLIKFMNLDKGGWRVPEYVKEARIQMYQELKALNKSGG